MKTIHQIIDNKLDVVMDLLEEHALMAFNIHSLFNEDDPTEDYLLEMRKTESKIKKAIRNAAALFEMEITISDNEGLEIWRDAYDRIVGRWHEVSRILHKLNDIDGAYLKTNTTTFKHLSDMQTLSEIVHERFSNLHDLFTQYYNLKKEMDKLDTPSQGDRWNELYMQRSSVKRDFVRHLNELATFLGFSINEGNFKPSFENYERIFSRLTVRWANSQSVLHQFIHVDEEFFENNEFPFRKED